MSIFYILSSIPPPIPKTRVQWIELMQKVFITSFENDWWNYLKISSLFLFYSSKTKVEKQSFQSVTRNRLKFACLESDTLFRTDLSGCILSPNFYCVTNAVSAVFAYVNWPLFGNFRGLKVPIAIIM
jgi:hypothetical protein